MAKIPSYGDYEREEGSGGKVIGRCLAHGCDYKGPMNHSSTGHECPKCKSMKLELRLKDGAVYVQPF